MIDAWGPRCQLWFDVIETEGVEVGAIYCVSFSESEEPRHTVAVGPYQIGLLDVAKIVNVGERQAP
jgi:hypothetical protein